MVTFLAPWFLLHLFAWILIIPINSRICEEELSLLPYVFIQFFIYVSMDSKILTLFYGSQSITMMIYLLAQIGSEEPFQLGVCAFWTRPRHLLVPQQNDYLFSGTTRCSRLLLFSCSNPPSSLGSFSQSLVFRNQRPWVRCVHITTLNVYSFL